MFKRLRTKIAEEAQRFPIQVGDIAVDNELSQATSSQTEQQDLIDLKNNIGSPLLQPENEQFSINDEDDSNTSETNSPFRSQENTSAGRETTYSSIPVTLTIAHPENKSPASRSIERHVFHTQCKTQTDTESEREESQFIELDGIDKEYLVLIIQKLKSRTQKYKAHYQEAINAYKEASSEKEKLQRALSDAQDRTLRRLAELREQCQLEQQAKAHLEQNLQMMLEEKEQMIYVLETKVRLLKEGNCSEKEETSHCENSLSSPDLENKKTTKEEDLQDEKEEIQVLKEKIKRQEALLAKCKDTIKSNKERTTQLIDEKNNLLEQLDQKNKEQKDLQVQEAETQSDLQTELVQLREKLSTLEKQQEENAMAMAETKRNMHEELELREQQLCKLKSELQSIQQEKELLEKKVEEQNSKYIDLQTKHEEAVSTLQNALETTENNMEKERENLMHELSRGKAAALNLLKEECGRKINTIEEEWNFKLEKLKEEHKMALAEKEKENEMVLTKQEEEFRKLMDERNKEMDFVVIEESRQKNAIKLETDIQKDDLLKEDFKSDKEDVKLLNMLPDESPIIAKVNESIDSEEVHNYKCQIAELNRILEQLRIEKQDVEGELKQRLESLQCENNKLSDNAKALHDLQREKEEINNNYKCRLAELNRILEQLRIEKQDMENELKQRLEVMQRDNDKLSDNAKALHDLQREKEEINNNHKCQIAELNRILEQLRMEKQDAEDELKQRLESLQCENNKLSEEAKALYDLQREKEEINNKLKEMIDSCNKHNESFLALQEESKKLKEEYVVNIEENELLKIKLNELERDKEEIKSTLQTECVKIQSEKRNLEEEIRKTKIRMELLNQKFLPKECNDDSNSLLKEENALLKEQLRVLETQTFGISHVDNYQSQLTAIKNNYEEKLKEKDMELSSKLKQMVRDFTSQMEEKETEYEKTLSSFIAVKGQELEGKMERKHREEMAALEQELYEKNCALEDVTEHYQQLFSEKEDELKNYKEKIIEVEKGESNGSFNENSQDVLQTEANDWEDGWMDAEDTTSMPQQDVTKEIHSQETFHCTEHIEHIKALESSIATSQEEIAELRFLLGLTDSSGSSSNANYSNEISLKLPEPTEFEYLRNILYEYMMGKEPMILARVIAAVLKFTEEQTHEILQRESVRQTLSTYEKST